MEFYFPVTRVLRPNADNIVTLRPSQTVGKEVAEVINRMGQLSAFAQGLPVPITTSQKFISSADNVLYIKLLGEKVVGFIKTGVRRLFHFSDAGVRELQPLCLLDFYVHESMQRSGFGKELYEFMLRDAQTQPHKIAIDRPSLKLQSFMRKHYNLQHYIPQSNNYVIYSQFFDSYVPSKPPRLFPKDESRIRSVGMMVLGEPRPGSVAKDRAEKTVAKDPAPRQVSQPAAASALKDGFQFPQRDRSARALFRPPWGIVDDLPPYAKADRHRPAIL